MKRVMAGLMAGVVVILMLTSPLAAYDRDVTLPSPNQSAPVWMYSADNGDDTGWDIPDRGTIVHKRKIPKNRIVYFNCQFPPLFVLHYLITNLFEGQIDSSNPINQNGSDSVGAIEENRRVNFQ